MRRLLAGGLAVAVLAPAPALGADDAGPSGTANYTCRLGSMPTDVTATLTMTALPESVAPGDHLRLRGTLTLGIPTQAALLTTLLSLSNKAGVSSGDFGIAVSTGAASSNIDAASVQGPEVPTPLGKAIELDATVIFDDFVVPADATDDLVLAMPAGGSSGGTAFTAALGPSSVLGPRDLSCAPSDAEGTSLIARVPVVPAENSLGASGGLADLPPDIAPPAVPDAVTSPAGVPPVDVAAPDLMSRPVSAPIPPNTREHPGIFIPGWGIALLGLFVPLAAIGYALLLWTRLRAVRAALGRRGPQ